VIVTVVAMGMVKPAIDEIVHVVTVGDRLMPAARAMHMASSNSFDQGCVIHVGG
jgi:hypothetical protein